MELRLLYSVLVIDSTSSTSSKASPKCELKFDIGYVSSSTQSYSLVEASVLGSTMLDSAPSRKLSIYFKSKINFKTHAELLVWLESVWCVMCVYIYLADLRSETGRSNKAKRSSQSHSSSLSLIVLPIKSWIQQRIYLTFFQYWCWLYINNQVKKKK